MSETTGVYRARITSKGQITIPAAVRRATGLKPGDEIAFEPKTRRFTPLPRRPLSELFGALPPRRPLPADWTWEGERAEAAEAAARYHEARARRVRQRRK